MPNWTDNMIDELVYYIEHQDPCAYINISEAVIQWMREHDMDTSYAGELEVIIEAMYRCGRMGLWTTSV